MSEVDWEGVNRHIDELYNAVEALETFFPGRKFTLDGHLVGSIGEVVAAYMFDLKLNTASTARHDAISADGQSVEIKFTQGKSIAIRHEPELLIVLSRPRGGPVKLVYNGPGKLAWAAAGKMQKNGQRPITLSKLVKLMDSVSEHQKLPVLRAAPI